MRLRRFAIAIFRTQKEIPSCETRIVDIDIRFTKMEQIGESGQAFLVSSTSTMSELPPIDSENRIVVPVELRERSESAIQSAIDLIATFQGCSRSVLSPTPSIAFEITVPEERDYLESTIGIKTMERQDSGVRGPIPLDSKLLSALGDRLAGVALLAEAYSGGEAGKYREFVRMFELAFRRPFTQLEKILNKFLSPTPFRYTRKEIRGWIVLRHPLSHADLKKTQGIAVTSDVRRHILRMEQAALDVLFNKKVWSNTSVERRSLYSPDACTTSESGNAVVKQGTNLNFSFRIYDEFGIFPKMLTAELSNIEDSCYCKLAANERQNVSP